MSEFDTLKTTYNSLILEIIETRDSLLKKAQKMRINVFLGAVGIGMFLAINGALESAKLPRSNTESNLFTFILILAIIVILGSVVFWVPSRFYISRRQKDALNSNIKKNITIPFLQENCRGFKYKHKAKISTNYVKKAGYNTATEVIHDEHITIINSNSEIVISDISILNKMSQLFKGILVKVESITLRPETKLEELKTIINKNVVHFNIKDISYSQNYASHYFHIELDHAFLGIDTYQDKNEAQVFYDDLAILNSIICCFEND